MSSLVLLIVLTAACSRQAAAPDPAAIEALLNETAERLSEPLSAEGRGYSYYTYGTRDLLYAVGDLDGDGRPEIAARAVYFLGVGSYDLVDVFSDRGDGYERVDFLNLYNLGLQDRVEELVISEGVLHIATQGFEGGREVRRCGEIRWPLDAPTSAVPNRTCRQSAASPRR